MLLVDHAGNVPTLANDIVVLRNGPSDKASEAFTIKGAAGAECSVLFQVCNGEGTPVWYFVEYQLKTKRKRVCGYVKLSDIDVDIEDVSQDLPSFYSLNKKKSYNTKTKKEEAYGIYCVQCVLYYHGYLKSIADCDGQYGPITTQAVLDFQKEYNIRYLPEWDDKTLLKEDGIWGPRTYEAFRQYFHYHSY